MTAPAPKTLFLRVAGTILLVGLFVVFMVRAPFLEDPGKRAPEKPPLGAVPPAELLARSTPLNAPALALQDPLQPGTGLEPTFGLFDATFAAADGRPGFTTAEVPVAGACIDAGKRYFESICPDCMLVGGGNAQDAAMLTWFAPDNADFALYSVSRDCIGTAVDGSSLVGMVSMHEGPLDLDPSASTQVGNSRIPLLSGASRVASISLGTWTATYDRVPRPSSALEDMADELARRGWREVNDPTVLDGPAFEGHRVFTDKSNALCMISLTKQGEVYQLLTIIDARA